MSKAPIPPAPRAWRPLWQLPALAFAWTLLAYALARAAGQDLPFPDALSLLGPPLILLGAQAFLTHSGFGHALVAAWDDEATPAPDDDANAWFWGGFALLVLSLMFLELRQPYYFTQDDNYCQFLPHQLAGLRGAWAQHRFPSFDPFEFAGQPLAGQGVYALTYPPTWAAWALVHALGHDTWLLELLAWAHLLAGYGAFIWVASKAGAEAWSAVLGALAWCLGGFLLIAGRSWFYVLPWAVWLPVMLGGLLWVKQGRCWPGFAAIALSLGCGLHSGNVQLWSYAVAFGALIAAIWTVTGEWGSKQAVWAALGGIAGLGLAWPLLWVEARTLEGNLVVLPGRMLGSWNPFSHPAVNLFLSSLPEGNPYQSGIHEVADQGTLVPWLAGTAALVWIARYRRRNSEPWALMALIAFIFSFGSLGGLWTLQHWAGAAAGFQHPFKALLFVQAFSAITAAVMLPRLLRTPMQRKALMALALILLCAHVWRCRAAFYLWSEAPYAALPPAEAKALDALPGRIAGVNPRWAYRKGYDGWLVHSLPSAYARLSLLGYDPLVAFSNAGQVTNPTAWYDTEAGLRAWGVSALLVSQVWNEMGQPSQAEARLLQWATAPGHGTLQADGLWFIQVKDPDPLAFVEPGHRPAAIRWDVGGADVDLPAGAANLTVATPSRPQWQARIDGQLAPLKMDDWQRLRLDLPAGAQTVRLDLTAPWSAGLLGGALLLALGLGGAAWMARRERPAA